MKRVTLGFCDTAAIDNTVLKREDIEPAIDAFNERVSAGKRYGAGKTSHKVFSGNCMVAALSTVVPSHYVSSVRIYKNGRIVGEVEFSNSVVGKVVKGFVHNGTRLYIKPNVNVSTNDDGTVSMEIVSFDITSERVYDKNGTELVEELS